MNRQVRSRACLCLLLAAACWAARPAASAAGGYTTTIVNKAGLSLSVQCEWINSGGYRPVVITIKPAKPSPADRSFHVEFHAKTPYDQRESAASCDFDLPAGNASATTTLLVPQYFSWQWFDLFVWEDGVHVKSLDLENAVVGSTAQDWYEGLPNILLVIDPLPGPSPAAGIVMTPGSPINFVSLPATADSSALAALLPQLDANSRFVPGGTTGVPAPTLLDTVQSLPSDQLPESWLAYSGLDMICLSFAQAEQLAAKDPPRWQAIRAWTVAGGNLLISDIVDDVEKLAAIDRMLGEPPARWQIQDPAERGWQTLKAEAFTDDLPAPYGRNSQQQFTGGPGMPAGGVMLGNAAPANVAPGGAVAANPAPQPAAPPKPTFDPAFRYRKHGLGHCVAIATDDLMAQSSKEWGGILNTLSPERWVWYRRHGVSPQRENDDFWNLPVLGVGLAPVTAFQVLITGFVIAIGPVNYWWLRRRGRLHLLVLVVPLSAAAVTCALFAYALAVDGLGVRVRARSYTEIDQRRGEAACWSRIAYYAGLAPSGGLKFGGDTVVIPFDSQSNRDSQPPAFRRGLIWSQGRQELVNGWLPSRTPVQLLTVRSRATSAGLRLLPEKAGQHPTIENRLHTRIEELLWADAEGECFHGAAIEPGAMATLRPADLVATSESLRQILLRAAPGEPAGFDRLQAPFSRSMNIRWQSQLNSSLPAATQASGLMERGIAEIFSRAAPGFSKAGSLPPRTYLAIVLRSPEVDYGVDEVEEAGSLHVIVGRW